MSFDFILHSPTEQCLNLAAKIYLFYVYWLRICQLFTVLTGVISNSLKKAVPDLYWIGGDISFDKAYNYGHFRFPIPVANWQFFV